MITQEQLDNIQRELKDFKDSCNKTYKLLTKLESDLKEKLNLVTSWRNQLKKELDSVTTKK